MFDKATYQSLLEQVRQASVLAQPSALEQAMAALQAQQTMIPRVQAYLRGEHKRSSMFRMVDAMLSQPPVQRPQGKLLTQALEAAMTRVPSFLGS